ncbi:hypothetical protein HK102_003806 [Quaeritorhiza haematococci]|nr:hypothetical protein HK102_003806 [Quaeritorhiza haematococci]
MSFSAMCRHFVFRRAIGMRVRLCLWPTFSDTAAASASAKRRLYSTSADKSINNTTTTSKPTPNKTNPLSFSPWPPALSFETQPEPKPHIPRYLSETYTWCYLSPATVPHLNKDIVVQVLLFGWANILIKSAVSEFSPGMRVLQPAAVYGRFSRVLAHKLGLTGQLTVCDVAPIQLEVLRPRIADIGNITLRLADARSPHKQNYYDGICCFFLLHEVPEDAKKQIVTALVNAVRPGGKVVFVDYHRPGRFHPLKPLLSVVADWLEPFAKGLWRKEVKEFCEGADRFEWRQELMCGSLYQKVVVQRPEEG